MAEKPPTLSRRERDIVLRLLLGQKQTTIAADLEISVHTVQVYVHRAKVKLRCGTLIQLAVRFLEERAA
jgi:DNA-binding NarL/FixJ family response regulator